jgi:ribosome recycling factor
MYGSIPKDTLAEILLFLVEKENFSSLKELGSISRQKLGEALTELAKDLKKSAKDATQEEDLEKLMEELKKPFQEIIAKLSDAERERLLKGFLN